MRATPKERNPLPRARFRSGALIAITAFLAYFASIKAGFVWDDRGLIALNPKITMGRWREAILSPYFPPDKDPRTAEYYRPLVSLLFQFEWALGGRPFVFHLTNVVAHAAVSVVVYAAARRVIPSYAGWVAFAFALHPSHVESVAWIAGRTDVLASLWMLAALLLMRRRPTAGTVALAAALACKELSATFPVLLLAWDSLAERRRLGRTIAVRYATVWLVVVCFFALRAAVVGGVGTGVRAAQVPASFFGRAAFVAQTIAWYFRFMAFPYPRNADPQIRLPFSPVSPANAASLLFWAGVVLVVLRWRRWPLFVFGIVWAVTAIVPASNIVPITEVVAERFTYLPTFGVLVATAYVVRHGVARGTAVLLRLVLIVYCAACVWRVNAWRDNLTLFRDTVRRSPSSARARLLLADAYKQVNGRRAVREYRRAIAIRPDSAEARNNLGDMLLKMRNVRAAIEQFRKALALNPPTKALIMKNLGVAYLQAGRVKDAEAAFRGAYELSPRLADAVWGLGCVAYLRREIDLALLQFQKAVTLDPQYADAYNNLGACWVAKGNVVKGIACFHKAVQLNPRHVDAWINLAEQLQRRREWRGAEAAYRRAILLAPWSPGVWEGLAASLEALGKHAEAQRARAKASRLREYGSSRPDGASHRGD